MKKILSLFSLLMLCIVGTSAQTTLYSWESPDGEVAETGGTIAYVNGDGNRLNYKNGNYYTICLNGKKANINDATPSANAGKMVLTLDQPLATGDEIAFTAYINKNPSTTASPYVVFETGTTIDGPEFGDAENIDATFGGAPGTKIVEVPESANGSKTITLTRSKTGTNLFIIKLVITRQGSATPTSVDIAVGNELPVGDEFVATFSSPYALDFTDAEGIKAYVAKKYSDSGTIVGVKLTAIDKVPANTGIIVKVAEPKTYTVAVTEDEVDAVDNDLVVAAEDLDLYDAVTDKWSFQTGPALLKREQHIDYNTFPFEYVTDTGFFPAVDKRPAAAGTDILPAGTVYLPITESDDWGYSAQFVELKFADAPAAEAAECDHIIEVLALASGTELKLNLSDYPSVSFANSECFVIEDAGKGIFVEAQNDFQAGDMLIGSITGTFSTDAGNLIAAADISNAMVVYHSDFEPEETTLGEAFSDYVQKQVVLKNLTAHVTSDDDSKKYSIEDEDGTEVELNTILRGATAAIETLTEGDEIEEITGYAIIVPETSVYVQYGLYSTYFFDPIEIKVKDPAPEPKPYEFVAAEWPSGDPGRISASNVTVDETANTITVNKDGDKNVALKFVSTNEYYVTPDLRYFTIRATGLSTAEGKTALWWLNNTNHGSEVAPSTIYEDGGVTVFAWDIRTCGLGDNFSSTENTTLQTTGDWITTFGLTLADAAVPAVISYIGFEASVPEPVQEFEYTFVATEWPAGDPGRISPSNVVVDETANTITVSQTGTNNVALNYKSDRLVYVKPGVKYFIIQAKGLSVEGGDSYLWWLNAKNNGGQVEPTYAVKDPATGIVSLVWDITADATFASGFSTAENTYLDGTGASTWGWTTTFGLTLANAAEPAVISYIGYEDANSQIAAQAADIASGIAGVAANQNQGNALYDVQGRKVAQPRKGGLYIQNGKKVVLK